MAPQKTHGWKRHGYPPGARRSDLRRALARVDFHMSACHVRWSTKTVIQGFHKRKGLDNLARNYILFLRGALRARLPIAPRFHRLSIRWFCTSGDPNLEPDVLLICHGAADSRALPLAQQERRAFSDVQFPLVPPTVRPRQPLLDERCRAPWTATYSSFIPPGAEKSRPQLYTR